MQIKEVMTPSPEIISPEASLAEAATMMKNLDVGSLPVSNGDSIVGWITDRDITIRATAEHRNPDAAVVKEAMSPSVVFCTENDDVDDCARIMEEKQIRRLPVLDAERRLVGIVALGDLALNTDKKLAGEILEKVSEPSRPNR
jgi:CBS domain-containing protein